VWFDLISAEKALLWLCYRLERCLVAIQVATLATSSACGMLRQLIWSDTCSTRGLNG
jgi:hypothetical protein